MVSTSLSLAEKAKTIFLSKKFFWFLGHAIVLTCSSFFYFNLALSPFGSQDLSTYYSWALLGALLSYSILIHRVIQYFRSNSSSLYRLLLDDNVQYTTMALVWYFSMPNSVALLPYYIYSSFHAVNYLTKTIFPTFFSGPSSPQSRRSSQQQMTSSIIQKGNSLRCWMQNKYGPSMRYVSRYEVIVIPTWLTLDYILGLIGITMGVSTLTYTIYFFFLILRYRTSGYVRDAFTYARIQCDRHLIGSPLESPYQSIRAQLLMIGQSLSGPEAAH